MAGADPIEAALADALVQALAKITPDSPAAAWEFVNGLRRDLQALREARAGVVDLQAARKRRGQP